MIVGIIYFTMNLVNGKTYIGHTTTCKKYEDHFGDRTYYGSGGVEFKEELKKYGKEAFVRHTIEAVEGTFETLLNRETYWIQELKPDYNKRTKATGNGACSEETKRKVSEGNKGKIIPEEWKRKQSERMMGNQYGKGNKGTIRTEEWKKRKSEEMMGKQNGLGAIHTEEQNKKHSEFMMGNQIGKANKGKTRTEEQNKRQSKRLMGNTNAKGNVPWNKGLTKYDTPSLIQSEEFKKNNR